MPVDGLASEISSKLVGGERDNFCSPNDQEVRRLWLMSVDWRSNEVVMDDSSDLATIHIAQEKWLSIANIQD